MSGRRTTIPASTREYTVSFPRMDGGLNTREPDCRLKNNESPELVNLWWKNGALCARDGQHYLAARERGRGWSAYESIFNGYAFFHIGDKICCARLSGNDARKEDPLVQELKGGVAENRGTWFRYGESLYYKNRGGYFRMDVIGDAVSCTEVEAYTPVILINTDPATAAGDEYQSENRLSGQKTVWYSTAPGVKEYRLPVGAVESVDRVVVDDEELREGEGYTVDPTAGTVTFLKEPMHHEPIRVNTVRITFTKENKEAYESIMDCPYAAVYGADRNVCVVMGGSSAQKNAYFWCGNHAVMDAGYFPFEQYNFAGDAQDAITGFGRQQRMLVIFKEQSIGRAEMGVQEMAGGRILLTMNYTAINAAIGCDLPGSIQLVENNLVFANTNSGVHFVRDTSAALENNIASLSRKVDRDLIALLRGAHSVCSYDDGERYWLAADGEVYLWDYALSGSGDPAWFYFTDIHAVSFLGDGQMMLHLDGAGRITIMQRSFHDYGGAIRKCCRFAAQDMGSYDRLKDITGVIFTVRGDTDTRITVTYETDHEKREDLTPVRSTSWRLSPRNLTFRDLAQRRFATVARRKPLCRHVRHFAMKLENNEVGMDMAVLSAQIFYRYRGRER